MPSNTFYNEILTDHNLHPGHKHDLPDANLVLEGVNPSCGLSLHLIDLCSHFRDSIYKRLAI